MESIGKHSSSWIFTCIRTHVRTHTCMHILSIKVNEKRWWIHARYFLFLQMLTSILFAAVGVVGAGYSVIVSSVAINHGPLCLVEGELWETPFSNGWDTDTSALLNQFIYSTSIVEYLAVAVQLLNRKKYIYFTLSMSTVSNTVVQRSALSPHSRKVVGTIPWPCSLSVWSLHALCFLLLSKDMSCDMLLQYTSRPWVQEEQWWNKCESF